MLIYPMRWPRLFDSLAVLIAAALCAPAWAQTYPVKPVRIVVPYVAGGATDVYARVVGRGLTDQLGQQFVIENRPCAATIIGAQAVAQAPKDGYTLLFTVSATLSANPHLYKQLSYKADDFAPVGLMGIVDQNTLDAAAQKMARAVTHMPLDGIAMSKINVETALDAQGVGREFDMAGFYAESLRRVRGESGQ